MSWGWANTLAAVLTLRDLEREVQKEEAQQRAQLFYEQCFMEILSLGQRASNLIGSVVQRACPVYVPTELRTGIRMLPLFCFGQVIAQRGRVVNTQLPMLDNFFRNFKYPFSREEYLEGVVRGYGPGDYHNLMILSRDSLGSFWLELFRAFCRVGTQEQLQELVDLITRIIMHFSMIGVPESTAFMQVCEDFVSNTNHYIHQIPNIPISGVDWLGVRSVPEHILDMRTRYLGLISSSNAGSEITAPGLDQLLDLLFLHSMPDMNATWSRWIRFWSGMTRRGIPIPAASCWWMSYHPSLNLTPLIFLL